MGGRGGGRVMHGRGGMTIRTLASRHRRDGDCRIFTDQSDMACTERGSVGVTDVCPTRRGALSYAFYCLVAEKGGGAMASNGLR